MDAGIRAFNNMQQLIDRIRFYHYISAVLENQVTDPLCSKCKACANSVRAMKEGLKELKSEDPASLPPEIKNLFKQAQDRIYAVKTAEAAEGQKTAGNCRLPKGVCFVKSSKALLKAL